jgi:hypothetical protein
MMAPSSQPSYGGTTRAAAATPTQYGTDSGGVAGPQMDQRRGQTDGSQTVGSSFLQGANPQQGQSTNPGGIVNPWQVNIADWDRSTANPSAKQRVQGYLSFNGQDPASYEYAINQTRPTGTAATGNPSNYGAPAGAFS